jgi:N-acetylneuraminic acid mutarotase
MRRNMLFGLLVLVIMVNYSYLEAAPKRALTLQERIACTESIEKIYWNHRIWPKENPQPKPSFESLITKDEMKAQTIDTLQKSEALLKIWKKPITAEQLQAEMNRIAFNTHQPDLLKELWSALNNDPHLIAECMVRPVLVDRLIREAYASDESIREQLKRKAMENSEAYADVPFETWWKDAKAQIPQMIKESLHDFRLPDVTIDSCAEEAWNIISPQNYSDANGQNITTFIPGQRKAHTSVWTGVEMIIWGGMYGKTYINTGGKYLPAIDAWIETSLVRAPFPRVGHTAVWTGTEMIIWGGWNREYYYDTGGRYNPMNNTWTGVMMIKSPSERVYHTAVWTGTEMIIWGGRPYTQVGGKYNPATNLWTAMSADNAPAAREWHSAIWSGTEMIIWGGWDEDSYFNSGARYNPSTNTWKSISDKNTPPASALFTAVWTGKEMIVWGGMGGENNGGIYNPASNTWTATSLNNAPSPRSLHSAVWSGTEMIIWGGWNSKTYFNNGGKYNLEKDSWTSIAAPSSFSIRNMHSAEWIGIGMIVWGGWDGAQFYNDGALYCSP